MLDLRRFTPPGYETKTERTLLITAGIGSAVFSLWSFLARYLAELTDLYRRLEPGQIDTNDFNIEDFAALIDQSFLGFLFLALLMLCFIPVRYAYHNQNGSRALYLMRRLPDRLELHRRCIVIPVAAAIASLCCAFILMLFYFAIYLYFTPDAWLVPGQWYKIWEELL